MNDRSIRNARMNGTVPPAGVSLAARLAAPAVPTRLTIPGRPANPACLLAVGMLAALWALVTIGCGKAVTFTPEVVVVQRPSLPQDPADAAWAQAPVHQEPLLLQDMVEPRQLTSTTASVDVRALTDGSDISFLLSWADATKDDLPGDARFSDACAVQLPARIEPDVPSPQMGETGKPVEITYWRAFWQATVDGRKDTINELYPGAAVGHYPFDAASLPEGSDAKRAMEQRYSPARALGNQMGGPRQKPVEDLVAEGAGTLRPAGRGVSNGRGRKTDTGWAVVLTRPLPEGLRPGGRTQVAFAIWQGGKEEVGARKMRSAWVPLVMRGGA
jgi:DMSO reductase family type II enzyme heme b subunit